MNWPQLEPWTLQPTDYHYADYDIPTIIVQLWFITNPRIKCLRVPSLTVSRRAFQSTFGINRLILNNEKYKSFKNNVFEKIYLVKGHPALSRLHNPFTVNKSLNFYCIYF